MNPFNKKTLTDSGVLSAGAFAGAFASKVAASKLDKVLEKPLLRHGALAVVGIALAAFSNPKDVPGKLMQGAGAGIAATQLTEVLKNVMTQSGKKPMEDGILKTGLSAPETSYVYVDSTPEYYPYENVPEKQPTAFLSAPEMFSEV